MANYLFEQMTDAQAAAYNHASDDLFFLTGSPASIGVTVNPPGVFSTASLTLTNGSVTHTFGANALAGESLTFFGGNSSDTLSFGHNDGSNADDIATVPGVAGAGARHYALGGDDSITGSLASDTIYGGEGDDTINGGSSGNQADFLLGGNGADSLVGGTGNDHIYGNSNTTIQGTVDGNDTISAGNGSDYVNGNGGNDIIDGGNGSDVLYGGNGADSINGGDGNGNDYLQGNKGDDTLLGGDGNDTLRGGADNDSLTGGNNDDHLIGDAGNDTIVGGTGYDDLTGGIGADVFRFAAGDASNGTVGTAHVSDANHDVTDFINDYAHGTDTIDLVFTVATTDVLHTAAGVSFSAGGVDAAQDYAQQLLDAHTGTTDIAAITVGTDTYLFFNGAGTGATIDSAIKLVGVADAAITSADFV